MKRNEKLKVLMYINHEEGKNNACDVYRNITPMKYADGVDVRMRYKVEVSYDVDKKNEKVNGVDIDTTDIEWADVVVFSRVYYNVAIMGAAAGVAKKLGKLVVYETDDLYHKIEQNIGENEKPKEIENAQRFVDWVLKEGASVTVTTETLAKEFEDMVDGNNIAVLGNYYDPKMWRFMYAYKKVRDVVRSFKSDVVRVGWQGGNNHFLRNFNEVVPALNQLSKIYPDKFQFVVRAGVHPNVNIYDKKDKRFLDFDFEYYEGVAIEDFPKALVEMDLDIGLAVVNDNEFSRSKSNIKWLEYSLLGIPTIASDVRPYQDTNALLVENKTSAWYEAIESLILDKECRATMGKRAREMALKYNAEDHAHKWEEFYRNELENL